MPCALAYIVCLDYNPVVESDPIIERFLEDICAAFPEIRPLMDQHEDFMTTSRMEAFATATTLAFSRNGDPDKGKAYLEFMSRRPSCAHPEERKYIDTYYCEHLFWQASEKAIKSGWPLVPENLKALYLSFHGRPPGRAV